MMYKHYRFSMIQYSVALFVISTVFYIANFEFPLIAIITYTQVKLILDAVNYSELEDFDEKEGIIIGEMLALVIIQLLISILGLFNAITFIYIILSAILFLVFYLRKQ